jgi:hypothetical protein
MRQIAADGGRGRGDKGAQFVDREGAVRQEKPLDLALPLRRITLNLDHNLQYTSAVTPKQSLTITQLTLVIES